MPACRIAFAAGIALLAALAASCRSHDGAIVVGSKNFGEQVLLGEIVAQTIEREAKLPVVRRLSLGGTFLCDRALRAGEIDLYVEYTGTAATAILKQETPRDPQAVFAAVRQAYARDGLEWTAPFGFDNTFAIVVRGDEAERLGLRSISDLSARRSLRGGVGYEFLERADGWRGLAAAYRLAFDAAPRVMDLGLLYRALADRQVDFVAGNSTDGLIASLGLRVLADDRHYFPPYQAAPIVRREKLERHPGLRAVLDRLGGSISDDEMRRLNYRVAGEGVAAEDVARDFVAGRRF